AVGRQPDGRPGVATHCRRCRLLQPEAAGRVDDPEIERAGRRMPRELALDRRTGAHEHQTDLEMSRGDERTVNDAAGPVVAAHRVDGDAHQNYQLSAVSCQLSAAPALRSRTLRADS